MISEIKKCIKLIKYAYGIKWAVIFSILFILFGLSMQITPINILWIYGGYMLLITAMFPTQLIYSLSVSNLIQGSSYKKKMQTIVPTAINFIVTLLLYMVYIVISGIRILNNQESKMDVTNGLIWLSVLVFIILIYNAITYKYYRISSIVIFVLVFLGMQAPFQNNNKFLQFGNLGFVPAVLIGIAILLLGAVLEYVASLLVYKAPISKMSQNASLRKYM